MGSQPPQLSVKRLFDILVSAVGIVVLSPLMLAVAAGVWLNLGRPVIFHQLRPGLLGCSFTLFKFRTMKVDESSSGQVRTDSERLTRFGRMLRTTSLDELPELWNVLKGEMSLVGPRPLLVEYLPLYSQEQMRRHEVLPGLTGWAQIQGRNSLAWKDRFKLDVWYVDNRSFLLDLKILCLTLWKVLRRDGINQDGEATMTKFTGSAP